MNLDSITVFNSSILQTNLLYLYLQRNLSSVLMKSQRQLTTNNQELLFSQIQLEVISLPKTECLNIISEPVISLNNLAVNWERLQSQNTFSVIDSEYLPENTLASWIDDQLNTTLCKLAKTIFQSAEQLNFDKKFIKVLFPSEGMFTTRTENNLIYFNCRVSVLVTPKYFDLL